MKKILFPVVFLSLSVFSVSCGSKHASETTVDSIATDSVDTVRAEEPLAFDSVMWKNNAKIQPNGTVNVQMRTVFPVAGSLQLQDSIKFWICEQLGDKKHTAVGDIPAFMKESGRRELKRCKSEVADIVRENEPTEESYPIEYEYNQGITLLYENDEYVTLQSAIYSYSAGAHGSFVSAGETFRKSDGHRMGWELLGGYDRKELRNKIKSGLMEYFEIKEEPNRSKSEQLREMLFGEGIDGMERETYNNNFPLPATRPYLTKDGVSILYQQYEIAPYAAGMPSCSIPLKLK